MKPGEWTVFRHTTITGTCIFPKIRRIKSIDMGIISFEDHEYPPKIPITRAFGSFPNARKARKVLEMGLEAWAKETSAIEALEAKVDKARIKRLAVVTETIMREVKFND